MKLYYKIIQKNVILFNNIKIYIISKSKLQNL